MRIAKLENNIVVAVYESTSIDSLMAVLPLSEHSFTWSVVPEEVLTGYVYDKNSDSYTAPAPSVATPVLVPDVDDILEELSELRDKTINNYTKKYGSHSVALLWPLLDAESLEVEATTSALNMTLFPTLVGFLEETGMVNPPEVAVRALASDILSKKKKTHARLLINTEKSRERLAEEYSALDTAGKLEWNSESKWNEVYFPS